MDTPVQIFVEPDKLVGSIEDFLKSLPADTKSVQVCMYAYVDNYDDYTDKTKCVAEGDTWLNLSEEARMELIGEAVTNCLQLAAEVLSAPSETEAEYAEAAAKLDTLRDKLKSLSRSFALHMENVDTAALASVQLERLFEGLLAHGERTVFSVATETFKKRKVMVPVIEDLQWKLMSRQTKPSKTHAIGKPEVGSKPVGKPINKTTASAAGE